MRFTNGTDDITIKTIINAHSDTLQGDEPMEFPEAWLYIRSVSEGGLMCFSLYFHHGNE